MCVGGGGEGGMGYVSVYESNINIACIVYFHNVAFLSLEMQLTACCFE